MTCPEADHSCPKCGSQMEIGFLLDNSYANLVPSLWIKGLPERAFWRLINIRGKTKRFVASYRCVDCGLLESYALDEWEGWPQW